MPDLDYGTTFDESGIDGKKPQSWDLYVLPFLQKIRTLTNTTGLDYGNLQTNGLRSSNLRNHAEIEVGRIKVRNDSGGALSEGDLIYFTGTYNDGTDNYPTVAKADTAATIGATFFAQGVVTGSIGDDADGTVAILYELTLQDTSAATVGDSVYLSTTAGGWTLTKPTSEFVQKVGTVTVVDASAGRIVFSLGSTPDEVFPVSLGDALTSIAGLTTAADKMIYTTASNTYAVADLSSFARTILDDADAAAVRTTIGAGTSSIALANDGATRLITGDGSGGLNGEENLTFDGTALQVTGTLTVGVDDTGHNVKFFGATTGKYMLWDEAEDTLAVVGTAITLNGTALPDVGTANTWTADQTFNDNVKVTLGTGGDADLYYDGTNVILDPDVVGGGAFKVNGAFGVNITPDSADGVHIESTYDDTNGTLHLQSNNNDASHIVFWPKTTSPATNSRVWKITPNNYTQGTLTFAVSSDNNSNASTQVMNLDSSGDVGIGTSTLDGIRFNVSQDTTDEITTRFISTAASPYGMQVLFSAASPDNNTNYFFRAADSTTIRSINYANGNWANHDGTYGTISDVKFKQDIGDARSYWDDFKSLQYRKFRHKADVEADENTPYRLGLIAQEVEAVFPALVPESPDPLVPIVDVDGEPVLDVDGEPTYEEQTTHKWVKSSIIEGPIMASVVQELQERDGEKSSRILALEARVEALEAV